MVNETDHIHYVIHATWVPVQPLESDSEEKDVGVVFDPALNFRRHINIMISKANQRVGLVKKTFSTLNTKNFKRKISLNSGPPKTTAGL